VKRIKLAYEHLAQKNEVYQHNVVRKCGCGYSAVTLWDLQLHQRSGYTKYDGPAAVSCNRFIWCCYCDDDMPYTVNQFSKHMLKTHNVIARISMPAVNPCPFCRYSRYDGVKAREHMLMCQKTFVLNTNLYNPGTSYDLPLWSSSQPRYRLSVPQNTMHASSSSNSSLHTSMHSAVSNILPYVTAPSFVLGPVRPVISPSPVPVPIALFSGSVARGTSVTHSASTNMLSCPSYAGRPLSGIASGVLAVNRISAPVRMPFEPVRIFNSGLGPLSGVSSSLYALRVLKPNIFGSRSNVNLAQNYSHSVPRGKMPLHTPSGSFPQMTFANSNQMVRNNVTCTTGSDVTTPSSSLQNSLASAHRQNPSSVSGKLQPKLKTKSTGKISGTSPKKQTACVSSARSPVVVLHRLNVSACEVCGSVFEKPELLCCHLLSAHSIDVTEKDFVQNSPRKSLLCVCCPLKFFSEQGLIRHMQIVHGIRLGRYTCPRCSETGISNLFEHFHLKHNVSVRMMVQWRVCYICKLNFSTVMDVERHVLSAHSDDFPTRGHFRQTVQAASRSKNCTTSQTQRNLPVNDGKNNMVCSDLPQQPVVDVNRKCHQSVMEVAMDSSYVNSGGDSKNVQTMAEKRKQRDENVVDLTSSEDDAAVNTSGNEPPTKKVRRSSSVSAVDLNCHRAEVATNEPKALSQHQSVIEVALDSSCSGDSKNVQTTAEKRKQRDEDMVDLTSREDDTTVHSSASEPPTKKVCRSGSVATSEPKALSRRNKAHEQHSACALDTGAILGTVSHITKNNPVVLTPVTKERKSGSNSASKSAIAPNVSVRLIPLSTVHGADSSVVSDVSIHIKPLDSLDTEKGNVEKGKGQSEHNTDSAVAKEGRKSTVKPAGISDVSIHIKPLDSHDTEKGNVEKGKGQSEHNTDPAVEKESSKSTAKPAGISDVSIHIEPLNSLNIEESSALVNKDKVRSVHDADSNVVPSSKEVVQNSSDSTNKPNGISDVSVRIEPLNSLHVEESSVKKDKRRSAHGAHSSAVPSSKESAKSSDNSISKPSGVSDVSVCIKPLNSLRIEGTSAEEDKGQSMHDAHLSTVAPSKSSCSSTSKPASVSDVSVHIKPVNLLDIEEPLVEKDKGRYRYV